MNPAWRTRYEAAVEAAQRAGSLALRYFDTDLAVEWKMDQSPVTRADREAEQLLRQTLLESFPDDGIFGEEFGDQPGSSGYRWYLDPIDGTRCFVRGIPLWGTLVGLEYKGEQIAGVAVAPALGLTYRALRGDGAYRGERRIRVSDASDLSQALVFYTGITWFLETKQEKVFTDLCRRSDRQRGFGDFYGYALVAQGAGELMVDQDVHPWDVAAVKPIVEEAGGRFSDWDGNPTIHRPDAVASNGRLHDAAVSILSEAERRI
jgi:histidinol-phosphatase